MVSLLDDIVKNIRKYSRALFFSRPDKDYGCSFVYFSIAGLILLVTYKVYVACEFQLKGTMLINCYQDSALFNYVIFAQLILALLMLLAGCVVFLKTLDFFDGNSR